MHAKLPKSYLYVPGNAHDKLEKALTRGAEALIIDLEDAVPLNAKDDARVAVVNWLKTQDAQAGVDLWVRANPDELLAADIRALANLPALKGIALAKCDSGETVEEADRLLSSLGDDETLLMPLIETAKALRLSLEIASGPRVHQIQIGEVDLAADLGIEPGSGDENLAPYRAMVVMACAEAGINPPLGPVSRETSDLDALEISTESVRRQGFMGRACIHPAQVGVANRVYTPTDEALEEAREVIRLYDEGLAAGTGVILDPQGRLIDYAVVRNAYRVVALAGS